MADAVPQQQYAAPAAAVHVEHDRYIQQTPIWVVVLRGAQVLLSLIVLGMAGYLLGVFVPPKGANGFAVATAVFTWIIVAYELVSEKVPSARGAYNIWAILSLDFVIAIFWLASLGANAALRASFNIPVYNSRSLDKRDFANNEQLAIMSAIAGLSALVWLLFIATLVFHGHTFRLWHQEHKKPSADNATVEMKAQGTPMLAPQPEAHRAAHPQYSDQQQYQSQTYPPQAQQPGAYPQQTPTAYFPQQQQEVAPSAQAQPYAAYPDPAQYHQQQQSQQQQAYSQQGTPAPGQPYYPPQQQQQPQQQAYSPHGTPTPGQPYYPPQQQQ